ncbi:MAG: GIY-YIG nuclease family protein [Patescibacteria group bacterium]
MIHYVYILKSLKDTRTYIGYTQNVTKRLLEHNSGKVDATKKRKPLVLLYQESCPNIKEVKYREQFWKNGSGRRKLKEYFLKGFPPIDANGRGSPS